MRKISEFLLAPILVLSVCAVSPALCDEETKEQRQAEQDAREVKGAPSAEDVAQERLNECVQLYDSRDFEGALKKVNAAIALVDSDSDFYSMRGACETELKQFPKALEDYTTAITLTVGNARDLRNRGELYVKMEKYENAVSDCTKAIELNPKYGAAYWWRAQALEKLGKNEEAAKDVAKAKECGYNGPKDDTGRDQKGEHE